MGGLDSDWDPVVVVVVKMGWGLVVEIRARQYLMFLGLTHERLREFFRVLVQGQNRGAYQSLMEMIKERKK